ncbi:MAG: cell division protein FtsZ [Dehalococcoidia bacterium]
MDMFGSNQIDAQAQVGMAQVKVIGVGGGGCNAVNRMYRERVPGVEYIAVNTDAQHLVGLDVPVKIRVGDKLTRGLGVGGDPEIGRAAAEESREELYEAVRGADMVFIAGGMGGGTGTGSAPVVAEVAKETGALTIAVVTKPFAFEGRRRAKNAEDGLTQLREHVDTLIVIPNDQLTNVCDETITADSAFKIADDVLRQGVQSIAELVTVPGEINLDFADVKTIMSGAGPAWMAIGNASGENRAVEAAKAAVNSPMLDVSIDGAHRVLLNITGGTDLTLREVQQAADFISRTVDPEANIIFGMVTDMKMEDQVRVTIIATGLPTVDSVTLQDDGIAHLLRDALDDGSEVDLPSFLRPSRHLA